MAATYCLLHYIYFYVIFSADDIVSTWNELYSAYSKLVWKDKFEDQLSQEDLGDFPLYGYMQFLETHVVNEFMTSGSGEACGEDKSAEEDSVDIADYYYDGPSGCNAAKDKFQPALTTSFPYTATSNVAPFYCPFPSPSTSNATQFFHSLPAASAVYPSNNKVPPPDRCGRRNLAKRKRDEEDFEKVQKKVLETMDELKKNNKASVSSEHTGIDYTPILLKALKGVPDESGIQCFMECLEEVEKFEQENSADMQ